MILECFCPFSSLNLNRPKHFHSRIAKSRRADYTVYELAEAVSKGQVRAAMDILVDSVLVLVAARKRPGAGTLVFYSVHPSGLPSLQRCLADSGTSSATPRLSLQAIDVDTEAELRSRYGEQVPVVTVNGKLRFAALSIEPCWNACFGRTVQGQRARAPGGYDVQRIQVSRRDGSGSRPRGVP